MPNRCGELTYMEFEVTPELVNKMAHIWVIRDYAEDFAGTHEEILQKAQSKLVPWPDQEIKGKPGKFYSGRKADFKGLGKKSYADKMAAQMFELRIFVDDKNNKSNDSLWIEGYTADAEMDFVGKNAKGIPLPTAKWTRQKGTDATGKKTFIDKLVTYAPGAGKNCGNYHIKIKDAVTTITVKIKLIDDQGNPVPKKVFDEIKKKTETFWNSEAQGFMQFVYHREGCQRGKACQCGVIVSQGEVTQAGCCKFPLRFKLEQGDDNVVTVRFLTLFQKAEKFLAGYVFPWDPKRKENVSMNTGMFFYPENRANTYAHEIGHMMGFPDQYLIGGLVDEEAVDPATPQPKGGTSSAFPIDDDCIMGGGQTKAKENHFSADWIKRWVAAQLSESIATIKNPAED